MEKNDGDREIPPASYPPSSLDHREGSISFNDREKTGITDPIVLSNRRITQESTEKVTEQELVRKAKQGDMRAFEGIVKKYERQIAATVIGMLGKCQAAEDTGQEVFVRFYKSIQNFREGSALGTYLTRIAINLSINELKRRKRRQFFFQSTDEEAADATFDPGDSIVRKEKRELVQAAIQRLEPAFRAVVVLRMIDGYSTEETATILGIPLGTVLSRLSRAQKKLKEDLVPFLEESV